MLRPLYYISLAIQGVFFIIIVFNYDMLTFNFKYFLLAFVLFVIEVLIALFVRDNFIRPYFGDYLVVILMYCAVRTFVKASPLKIAIGVLLFSYIIEVLQYFKIVDRLGLSGNIIA